MNSSISNNLLFVCLTGGESTGKTTLCKWLADHFHTTWVPEYAREYLDGRDLQKFPFVSGDFIAIAKGQLERMKEAKNKKEASKVIFCDTDALLTVLWSKFLIGSVPEEVLKLSYEKDYSFWLLSDFNVPYEPDELRFISKLEERQEFHDKIVQEMTFRKFPFELISGNLDLRKRKCVEVVEQLLKQNG